MDNGGVDKSADQTFVITINPLPTIFNVTGGGSYCSGGSGVAIGLFGSQSGVTYQLYSASSPVGSPVSGTGSVLSFGNQTTAGTNYTVIATNTTTTCTQNMSGSAIVTINALPTTFTVNGGGSYCSGGSGVAIGLSGSQSGVTYQLYSASTPVGSPVAGTGSVLSFGNQTTAGTNYTVIATNTTTTCTQNMNGSVTVTINPLPTTFTVTGGGSYCSGGSGVAIGLSGSQTGVSYQLYSASTPVGLPVSGTGSALSFGNQTTAGANYNVIATNATTTCTQNMSGSATVTINTLPINPTVSTSTPSNVCPLKTVDLTSLLTSTTPSGGGILFKTTNNPLGLSITDPTKAGAGTYFIFYQNSSGCYSPSTAVTVAVNNCPPIANSAMNATIPSTAGATAIFALTATDDDGTIAGYTVLTLPLHGILYVGGVVMTAGQVLTPIQVASLTYDPNGSFIGNDTFTFTAKDNNTAVSNIGIFTIPVGNNPPVANNATNATIASTVDATAISALTAADSDGSIASYTVLTLPSHGTLSVGGTAITAGQILTLAQASALAYDPDGSFIGNDSFTFLATDNNNSVSNTATISIPVGNNPPVANSTTNPTIPSTAGATTLAALTATDTDGSIVSYTILTLPSHGILYLAGIAITMGQVLTPIQASVITYLPNGTHTGNDSFIFTATDNSGTIDTTPATITIPVGNNPPVANPDVLTTNEDTSVSFNITTNDTDTDGTIDVSTVDLNPLSAGRQMTFTVSEQGSYVVDNLGVVTFTPFVNYNGTAIPVNYTVNDNLGAISNISTISVTVTPINDPPVATPDTKTTAENNAVTLNVTTNDTDIDGTVDVATVDLNPSITGRQTTFTVSGQGTYTVNNLGVVTFTPVANYNGNATPIGYTVNDNNGAVSNTSTITITVTALNAAPVPVDDNATTTQNVNVKISVLDNDSFGINGSSTGAISATNGSHGTVLVDNGGTPDNPTDDKIIYAPNSGYIGSDTFTYTICNSKGSCSTANVTVTIHPLSGIFIINMSSTKPVMNRDGVTFSWAYIITLNNKQSQLVDSIRIVDDLNKAFEVSPKPTFTVTKVSVSGNTLNVNSAYNGVTDINLLSGRSYLNANTKDSIIIEVNVNPAGYAGQLLNKAYLDGLTAVGKIKDAPSDDVNLPGAFDETITTLKGVDLIIPEGFTPNMDGYNDNFVIVHSDLVKLKLSIFNRWGSQVYSSTDYKNNWDGKGSGGNDLPTGTYFLEISVIEVSTGNIIESEIRSITLIR